MIDLEHITKIYETNVGPHLVLDDVSLHLGAGESLGVLGRNGAGKSTLMRIIAGAEMPNRGTVRRSGRISWPIGFAGGLHGSLTGEENCRFVARIYGEDIRRVVEEAREFADIGKYFQVPVRTYSSGMRARLAFGLSMSIDFDVYLLDEVTAVGDRAFRRKCRRALRARRKTSSFVMVTHNLAPLRRRFKRCAVLDKGKLEVYESVREAAQAYRRSGA